jgi:hypothetical protein
MVRGWSKNDDHCGFHGMVAGRDQRFRMDIIRADCSSALSSAASSNRSGLCVFRWETEFKICFSSACHSEDFLAENSSQQLPGSSHTFGSVFQFFAGSIVWNFDPRAASCRETAKSLLELSE